METDTTTVGATTETGGGATNSTEPAGGGGAGATDNQEAKAVKTLAGLMDAGRESEPATTDGDGGNEGEAAKPVTDGTGPQFEKRELEAIKFAGLDVEDVKLLGEDKAKGFVEKLVATRTAADKAKNEAGQLRKTLADRGGATSAEAQPAKPVEPPVELPALAVWTPEDIDPVVGVDGFAEGLNANNKALQARFDAQEQRFAALEAKFAERVSAAEAAADAAEQAATDKRFAGLDPKVYGMFGSGSMGEMDAESVEAKARYAVTLVANKLMEAAQQSGEELDEDAAFKQALAAKYPEQSITLARSQAAREADRIRRGNGVGPSGRHSAPATMTAEEKMVRELAAKIDAAQT